MNTNTEVEIEKLKLAVEKTVLLHKLMFQNKGESDEADKIRDELHDLYDCLKHLPEEKEWLRQLSASLDFFSKEISSSELQIAAEEWVFEKNGHKWSNNNDEAGDNFGSFLAGAEWVLARRKENE